MARLPRDQAVVFTEALADGSDWADETWNRYLDLAKARGPLFVVHLHCNLEENTRRITSLGRLSSRKPVDAEYAKRWHELNPPLVGRNASNLLELHASDLSPEIAATQIREWVSDEKRSCR